LFHKNFHAFFLAFGYCNVISNWVIVWARVPQDDPNLVFDLNYALGRSMNAGCA